MRVRLWGVAGAAMVIGVLVAGLGLWEGSSPEPSDAAPRPSRGAVTGLGRLRAAPTPPPSGDLRIRGLVRDERGPVAGARVSATRPMPGETLSELPCPEEAGYLRRLVKAGRLLPECMEESRALVLELVGMRHGEAPVYAETVTGADGSFVLNGLPEGAFALWALGERGAELRPGVSAGTEDVELVLGKGQMVEGRVVDPSNHPLPGARVTLLHTGHTRFFDAQSDGAGRFRVGPLPKGEYGLVAEKEDWLPGFVSPERLELRNGSVVLYRPARIAGRVLSAGAPAPGAEVRLKGVEEGVTTDAEGRFAFERVAPGIQELTATRGEQYAFGQVQVRALGAPLEEVLLRLEDALYAEGTVRDEAHQPVAEVSVSIRYRGNRARSRQTVTDAEGHYRFGPLEVGMYSFGLSARGYTDVWADRRKLTRGMGPIDFTLTRSVSISGRVVDEDGNPVEEVSFHVEATGDEEEGAPGLESGKASDEEGRFWLDVPKAGAWNLLISDERFLAESRRVQAPSEGMEWVLRRGGIVEGQVTDEQGAPLDKVTVALWQAGTSWSFLRSMVTDEEGRFAHQGLKAGSYVVEASLERAGVERLASRSVEVQDTGHAEASLRFEAGWSVSGIAVDEEGQPLAGVSVGMELPDEALSEWRRGEHRMSCGYGKAPQQGTGPDGRFTLSHLTAEAYDLWAVKRDYTWVPSKTVGGAPLRESSVRVRSGAKEVRLVFRRDARVTGRLVGPEGAPIPRFELNHQTVEDASGAFAQSFDTTGSLELKFSALGMASVVRSVEVKGGVDVDLGEVRMEPGRRVDGRVVDAETGEPVGGAIIWISAVPEDGPDDSFVPRLSARSSEDGSFAFANVEAQPFLLRVSHPDYRSLRQGVGAGDQSLTVQLDPGATVAISITDSEGRPVKATVSLMREDDTVGDREYVQEDPPIKRGLEPGTYLVQVHGSGKPRRTFLPQRVNIPPRGRVPLTFVERREGATLTLRTEGVAELSEAILFPGATAPPVSMVSVPQWGMRGLIPEHQKSVLTFRYLPPGRAWLLLIAEGSPRFHLEELEIPPEGVIERAVSPRWQPVPDK